MLSVQLSSRRTMFLCIFPSKNALTSAWVFNMIGFLRNAAPYLEFCVVVVSKQMLNVILLLDMFYVVIAALVLGCLQFESSFHRRWLLLSFAVRDFRAATV